MLSVPQTAVFISTKVDELLSKTLQRIPREVGHLTVAQCNEDLRSSHPRSLRRQSRNMNLPSIHRDQCCFTFGVLMGTELTDWYTTRLELTGEI